MHHPLMRGEFSSSSSSRVALRLHLHPRQPHPLLRGLRLRLLLQQPLLLLLRLLLLDERRVRLRELLRRRLLVPAPLGLQVAVDEADAPPRFLVDLVEDLEDFFLLAAVGQDLGGVGEGAEGDGGDAAGMESVWGS